MQLMAFALGVFLFAAFTILIYRYTTYLSNTKKDLHERQELTTDDTQHTVH